MRSTPLARVISATAALTLLTTGAVSAQVDTQYPQEIGPTLLSGAVTSALDDAITNELISTTVREYHRRMGGKMTDPNAAKAANEKKKKTAEDQAVAGLLPTATMADSAGVTRYVQDTTAQFRPNMLVVSGGDGQANVSIARTSTDRSLIIDLAQPRPCLDSTGAADPTGECAGGGYGGAASYTAVEFAVEEGAYLAGVLAAKASRGGDLGVISGYEGCRECQRYVEGFVNGARSIAPEIVIEIAYLADDELSGFGDPASAKTFTEAFIDIFQPTVLLPVGRAVTPAMIEAACDAEVQAIGTGYDMRAVRPDLDCIMTSVTRDTGRAVAEAMYAYSFGQNLPLTRYDLADGGVGITPDWPRVTWLPVDTEDTYEVALESIRSGVVEACPEGCGGSHPDEDEPVTQDE